MYNALTDRKTTCRLGDRYFCYAVICKKFIQDRCPNRNAVSDGVFLRVF